MIPSQRDSIIIQLLAHKGVVTVAEICTQCNCSPETARRDLRRLEQRGELTRTHGGAKITGPKASQVQGNGSGLLEARIALTERVDALIVTPSHTRATDLLVDRCSKAGVPVVAEAIGYTGARTVVGIDNFRAGLEAGQWVANYVQRHFDGKAVVLDVTYSQANTEKRSRGFSEGLRELPDKQVRMLHVNGQGVRESSRQIAADAISVHPDINVIFGVNDDSALGALDAYRAAGLDEENVLVVCFGLEGDTTRDLLDRATPYAVCVAMFPELVGRACLDAAICTYHGCALMEQITTPHAIVTPETLHDYYERDVLTGTWEINFARAEHLSTTSTGYALLRQCQNRPKPRRVGYVGVFRSHEWYQNVQAAMQNYSKDLGIPLEIIDVSQDVAHEINTLKQDIGFAAAKFVHDGDTIILDAGYTAAYVARALRGKQNLTVITSSLLVLAELEGDPDINVVVSGGEVKWQIHAMTGPGAEATFRDLRVDKAFVSVTGLTEAFGLSGTNIPESTVKQSMIQAAREVFILADSTKIGMESLVKIAPIGAVDRLITDAGINPHDHLALTQQDIEVIIAGQQTR